MRRIGVPRRALGSLSSGTGTRARRSCRTYRSRFAVNSTKTLRHPVSAPTPPPSASPAALRTPTADQRDRQSKKFVATSRPSFSERGRTLVCSGLRPRPEPCDERYVGLYGTGISLEETNPPAIPRCDTNEACSIEVSVTSELDCFHTRIVKMIFDN